MVASSEFEWTIAAVMRFFEVELMYSLSIHSLDKNKHARLNPTYFLFLFIFFLNLT